MAKKATRKEGGSSGKDVPISSLTTLQPFTYKGKEYTKRRAGTDSVTCLSAAGDKLITLSKDTLVTPA